MMHGSGWWTFIRHDESNGRTRLDRQLLRRVFEYARPYWGLVALVLLTITITSLLELIPPLLYRDLIDNVIPNKSFQRLNWLALGMIGIPLLSGLIGVAERYFSARAGEGIIFDLRQQMYSHLQTMSLRFFTHTKSGEIISRFNNDVVGAQSAITGTLPNIVTNVITLVSTLIVMISIEWRLAVLSVVVLPSILASGSPGGAHPSGYPAASYGIQRGHEQPDQRNAEHQWGFVGKNFRTPAAGSEQIPRNKPQRTRHRRSPRFSWTLVLPGLGDFRSHRDRSDLLDRRTSGFK